MKIPINAFDPCFEPAHLVKFLLMIRGKKISPRMVSHVVQTTIGEAAIPADGRGRKRMFSLQDIALVVLGIELLDLGLPPGRVKICVEAAKNDWSKLFPHDVVDRFQGKAPEEEDGNNKYLVAGYNIHEGTRHEMYEDFETRGFDVFLPVGFWAEIWDEEMIRGGIGRYLDGPDIIYLADVGLAKTMEAAYELWTRFS